MVKSSPSWCFPIVTAAIVDAVAKGGEGAGRRILLLCLFQAVLLVQNIPTHTLFARLQNGSLRRAESRIRMSLLRKLLRLSFSFHDGTRSGVLQAKVLRDAEAASRLAQQLIGLLLSASTKIAIPLAVTLSKDPRMALVFAVALPLPVILIRMFKRRIRENASEYRRDIEGMNAQLSESLTMLPLVRVHATEEAELGRLSEAIGKVEASGKRLDIFNGIFGSTSWVAFEVASLACLGFTAMLGLKGGLSIGDIVLYNGFFVSILGSVDAALNVLPELTRGFESLSSISELLNSPEDEDDRGKLPVREVKGAFTFEEVGYRYPKGSGAVLHGLSFEVSPGTSVAVVGESGSGKSTLMGLVTGVLAPTEGRVLLDGRDLRSLRLRDYRARLSVVSQNILLFSGSVRENLCYGLEGISAERLEAALEAANALGFVRELPEGLETSLGELGGRLSGGQRQRLAIARALVRDPQVLVLDEATSALDRENESLVQEALERLMAGRTTFIVAHRLSTIRKATRILVLGDGRLVESGSWAELNAGEGPFARMTGAFGQFPSIATSPRDAVAGG
jgi:ATP-binding cassette subfamily B protein